MAAALLESRRRLIAVALTLFLAALAPAGLASQLPTSEEVRSERSSRGMVVSEFALASQVGRDVLAAGGNAVDAAIATGLALAVTHPTAGNIGGGGFMVIRFPDGRATALDFREKAPLASHAEMFVEGGEYSSRRHHNSYVAVGVPGTVAGFDKAHRLYGSTQWERLVYPAVALAEDGFPLTERLAESLANFVSGKGGEFPATVQAFSKSGTPYREGEVFKQPDLARTLTRIMQDRRDGFYAGETARLLAEEMSRGGGIISERDLEVYQAKERTPVVGEYKGYQVISMPPPSSGGVALVEMLNILEGYDLAAMGHNSPRYLHHLAEAMRRAFRDRARYLADQDFVDVPVHRLTSESHASELRLEIDPTRASASSVEDVAAVAAAQSWESPETTHYSVVDADGMAVSVTYTLEQGFGTGITVTGAGFLLNNEMGDFNARPGLTTEEGLIGTNANLARPEQRMLSSMSPAILARDGQLVGVVGSPGGRTIINTVLQLVLNRVDFQLPPEEIVRAGRMHHQWLPDRIVIEEGAISQEEAAVLEAMGHTVLVRGSQGRANSIFVDPRTRELVGVPDVRSPDSGAAGS